MTARHVGYAKNDAAMNDTAMNDALTDDMACMGTRIVFDHYDPDDERRRGALLTLGNGLLSMRASAPEAVAASCGHAERHYAGLYRAGWYDEAPRQANGYSTTLAALVNLPDPFGLSFSTDHGASWFSLDSVALLRYRQTLALDVGILSRELAFRDHEGREIQLTETRLMSMDRPHLGVLRWQLYTNGWRGPVRVRSVLDASVTNGLAGHNAAYEGRRLQRLEHCHRPEGLAAVQAGLQDRTRRVVVAMRTALSAGSGQWHSRWEDDRLIQESDGNLCGDGPGNSAITIEKTVLVLVDAEISADDSDPHGFRHALGILRAAPSGTMLEVAHGRAWQRLWQRMPVHAEAPWLEDALRFHCFHVLQTISPHSGDHDMGFPARGWQEGYFGQIFWDEIFAFPFLSSHWPALARSLLMYRHARLDTARRRAACAGYRGAMFPWRSGRSGEEETPPFQFNPQSGHWMADHSCLQRHIGAAIAYNAWHHCLATGDMMLLAGAAGELIMEIARFWASIARYDESRGRYVICGVLGPDEYHDAYPHADAPGFANNAYTNVMAVWTLCRAFDVLAELPASASAALRQRLAITEDELTHWERVSRHMYVPLIDDGVISQFEGFDELRPVPRAWLEGDHPRVDWWLEAQGDSVNHYQLTKQADVLMLLHLFPPRTLHELFARLGYVTGVDACRRTANYYMARITHESSLSKMVCAGALARLDPHASWQYFSDSLRSDLEAPSNGGVQEGVHLGAMAGTLDVLQRHYLGIGLAADGLHIHPAPPPSLGKVRLDICYRGQRFSAALENDGLHVTSHADNVHVVTVTHDAGASALSPGSHLVIPC